MPAAGGPPQSLTRVDTPRGGSWGSRDVILFAPYAGSAIWRINADGSGAANVTEGIRTNADLTHRWPTFLPDGNRFLFWAGNFGNDPDDKSSGIYSSSLDKKERNLVLLGRSSFAIGSDHIYYADDDRQLISQPFDPEKAAIAGSRPSSPALSAIRLQPTGRHRRGRQRHSRLRLKHRCFPFIAYVDGPLRQSARRPRRSWRDIQPLTVLRWSPRRRRHQRSRGKTT